MKNNQSGVTLVNLVVMIVIMLVLISITGFYSLDNIRNSHVARQRHELASVVDYVSVLRAKIIVGTFSVPTELSPISDEALLTLAPFLSPNTLTAIIDVNTADGLDNNYKYFYLTPTQLENRRYSDGDVVVKDAKYNYIVNYYTGTVIALYGDSEYEVSGLIKGLPAILNELDY